MKIQSRNLIVALFVVMSSLAFGSGTSVFGQDANTVDIRATVPPAGRGFVAADVTVDQETCARRRVGHSYSDCPGLVLLARFSR